MEKYELLPQQLLFEGTITPDQFFEPKRMSGEQIRLTHDDEYYRKLIDGQLSAKEIRRIGFPMRQELIERGHYIAMGTLEAARFALEEGIALNIAGGTHHAYAGHGEGFCIFNDFAIAANVLLAEREVKQILIVDLDVHQGNGTARIFYDRAEVFTFSMHGERNYPLRKEKSDLDIGLADHTSDNMYLKILGQVYPTLVEEVKPDIIFYLAGADILDSDHLGRIRVSKQGARYRDELVLSLCERMQIPVVVAMGGGYSPRLRDVIEAHANTFRVAMHLYN